MNDPVNDLPTPPAEATPPAAAAEAAAAPHAQPAPRANRRGGRRRFGARREPAAPASAPEGAGEQRPPQPQPRRTHPLLEQLAGWYPHLFGAQFLPLKRGIFHDLMAAHGEAIDKDRPDAAWAVRVYHKPFVVWIWGGCVIMALGGALAMSDRRYRMRRNAKTQEMKET